MNEAPIEWPSGLKTRRVGYANKNKVKLEGA